MRDADVAATGGEGDAGPDPRVGIVADAADHGDCRRQVPTAPLVDACNSVGNPVMVDPHLPGGPPTMCVYDADAKVVASGLLEQFGWEAVDLGAIQPARAIEPLCMLRYVRGFAEGSWGHAFKRLRPGPQAPPNDEVEEEA